MSERLILDKLNSMEERQREQGEKISKIESAINSIAVQSERINNLTSQIKKLWEKHDQYYGPDGFIMQIQNFQNSCPRKQFNRMWWAIGLLATLVVAIGVKTLA